MKAVAYRGLGDWGGAGNQLWQIAATVGVARTIDASPIVDPEWKYRAFFSLPEDWYSDDHARHVAHFIHGNHWAKTYCQDPSLWAHVADEIRAAFAPSPRAQAVLDALPEPGPDDVAVHVRRGDYLTLPRHLPFAGRAYYADAAWGFTEMRGDWGVFDVFTDDADWCKGHLPWPVVSTDTADDGSVEPRDWLDLFRMARYRSLVIANSSYSWWAAFLAGPDATVVAPARWFGPAIDVPSPALDSWIEVQC